MVQQPCCFRWSKEVSNQVEDAPYAGHFYSLITEYLGFSSVLKVSPFNAT